MTSSISTDVFTVALGDPLRDASRLLRTHGVSAALVTDDTKLVGIISERDIVQAVVDGADPSVAAVADRMTTDLITLAPDADRATAVDLMVRHHIRHIPVVDDDGHPVGMFSVRDQLAATTRERRPATDFGETGVVTHFRGPFSDGPPADALEVTAPELDKFGVAELRRMIVICWVLALSILQRLVGRIARRRTESWATAGSEGLVDGFERLGPTFVKLGQLVASSPGVFPAPLADAALRCLDEVPPFDAATVRQMIAEDLGRPPAQVFRHFDDTPLSAASIGQVHACTLPDGREAVIKLQRPAIRERMTVDLRIMHRLAKTLERHTKLGRTANVVGVIEDMHTNTFHELNPAVEARRQQVFRDGIAAFGDNAEVTAPEVYWDYCGPRMICMERMAGVPMDDFDTIRERGLDGELVMRRAVKVWMEAMTIHGTFHGDLHAGNLWVLDDGRVTFLDFGIMGVLTPEWRAVVRSLFRATIFAQGFASVARAFKDVGAFPEDVGSDEEVGARLEMVIGPMLDQGLSDISIGDVLKIFIDMMEQYSGGAGAPREMLLVLKQMLYIERYTKELAPDWTLARDVYLVRNVFPDESAARAAELGLTLPA